MYDGNTLFYCGVKQKSALQMKLLKDACKKNNVKVIKSSSKDQLCQLLGEYLFQSKTVVVIDPEKDLHACQKCMQKRQYASTSLIFILFLLNFP
jgi:uncharacterized protein YaaQ